MITALMLMMANSTLVLKPEASVEGKYIPLLDVVEAADLSGDQRNLLKAIYLGKSPEAGAATILTANAIRDTLARRGVTAFAISGEKVTVTRAEPKPAPEAKPVDQGRETVAAASGKLVYAAAREIRVGEVLTEKEIKMVQVSASEANGGVTDPSMILRGRAAKKIPAGEKITLDQVKRPPVIRRRDLVTARSKYLEATAYAAGEGAVGDIITLEFERTKNKFKGRVISETVVEIVEE